MNRSEPLIASQSLNCISTISNENSSLIENRHRASTSDEDRCKNDEFTVRRKCLKDDVKVDVHGLQNARFVGTDVEVEENEKPDIVQTETVGCENEIAVLDASGLPSYDTALKIQECGNMWNCF